MGIIYLSHSQIDLWQHCPRKWEYRYIKGIKTRTTSAQFEGTIYHTTLEQAFLYYIKNRSYPKLADCLDVCGTAWYAGIDEDPYMDWGNDNEEALLKECMTLVAQYMTHYAPSIIPVEVELGAIGVIDGVKIIGKIDLIDINGTVVDEKTSSRKYTDADVEKDYQPSAYAFLLNRPISFENHVAVKAGNPWIQIVKTQRTLKDIEWWVTMVKGIIAHMNTGVCPPRSDKKDYLCSPNWCGLWDICRRDLSRVYH
jgi:putative RecB family exonuclease